MTGTSRIGAMRVGSSSVRSGSGVWSDAWALAQPAAGGGQAIIAGSPEEVAGTVTPPAAGSPKLAAMSDEDASAAARASAVGDDPDADPEQLLALFPDGAGTLSTSMDEMDLVLGQRMIFSDLRTLQDRINDTQSPTANAVVRYSSQSDDLDIRQAELSQDLFFGQGRSQLRLGLQAIDYAPRVGRSISQYAAGGTGNYRISNSAAFTGEFWVNELRANRQRDTKLTYNAFVTLRPSDAIRIDVNTSRRLFDNLRSLQLGLTVTSYGASIDFTPMDDLRLTARGAYGRYSDGTRRRTEELEGVWRITSRPVIEVGVRATNFHFTRLLDNGYFNPRNYYSGEGVFRLKAPLNDKLDLQVAGSAGVENAEPGGTRPLVKGSLQLAYKLTDRWSLDGEIAHFSSRASTSSGFSRTSALLGLHYRF